MTDPAVSLGEIRQLATALPAANEEAAARTRARLDAVAAQSGGLGLVADLAVWLATWQAEPEPDLRRPRVTLFAASHGHSAAGIAADLETVRTRIHACLDGGAPVNQACSVVDPDLRLYELDLDRPTGDITAGPAMDDEAAARALAYGMMTVDQGLHLLVLGEVSVGSAAPAAALAKRLVGIDPPPGLRETVSAALAANPEGGDALDQLQALGGYDIAAIVGSILAARMARTPVLLDGPAAIAAAAVVAGLRRDAADHCRVVSTAPDSSDAALARRLGLGPLLDLGIGGGQGMAAALAIPLMKTAAGCAGLGAPA